VKTGSGSVSRPSREVEVADKIEAEVEEIKDDVATEIRAKADEIKAKADEIDGHEPEGEKSEESPGEPDKSEAPEEPDKPEGSQEEPEGDTVGDDAVDEVAPPVPPPAPRGYVVDPNYVPRSIDRTGSIRTEDLGIPGRGIEGVAMVFRTAGRRSLLTAARALDVRDRGVADNQVTLSPQPETPPREMVAKRIEAKLAPEVENLTIADTMVVATTRDPALSTPPPIPGTFTEASADQVVIPTPSEGAPAFAPVEP
jgi:hypothetical protein